MEGTRYFAHLAFNEAFFQLGEVTRGNVLNPFATRKPQGDKERLYAKA
jgi:hypothetical protein